MLKNKILISLILTVIVLSSLGFIYNANAQKQVIMNNPLDATNKKNLGNIWQSIVKMFLELIGVASLFVFVYAGFTFLVSAGNAEKTKKARDTMLYAVLGIFLAMAAYVILSFVFSTIETSVKPINNGQAVQAPNPGNQVQ